METIQYGGRDVIVVRSARPAIADVASLDRRASGHLMLGEFCIDLACVAVLRPIDGPPRRKRLPGYSARMPDVSSSPRVRRLRQSLPGYFGTSPWKRPQDGPMGNGQQVSFPWIGYPSRAFPSNTPTNHLWVLRLRLTRHTTANPALPRPPDLVYVMCPQ